MSDVLSAYTACLYVRCTSSKEISVACQFESGEAQVHILSKLFEGSQEGS